MAGARRFPSRIKHIQQGEPVTAGVAGRPDRTLEGRTNYLNERLDEIEAGRALVHYNQPVASDVLVGQPVYWNEENQQYEQALAGVENDNATGSLAPTAATDCVGMVLTKLAGNVAHIVLWGLVAFDDISNAITSDSITPGRYYLSQVQAGTLSYQRPPVTVPVCFVFGPLDACDEKTWVFVQPMMRDFLEDHIHYQFNLQPVPAGDHTPPAEGEVHVITNADAEIEGWLPADHASFNGMAPTGAKFGYNIAANEGLSRVFPPIPVTASVLEMQRPSVYDTLEDPTRSFKGLERVSSDFVVVTKHGIWWMTNCYNEVPWPTNYGASNSSSSLSSAVESSSSLSSESAGNTCPVDNPMRLIFSFIKMTFATDKTVVTSLQPDEGQPLEYVNCDGAIANTGELFSRLKLALLVEDEFEGGQVLKGVTDDNKFKRGWAAEGLIAGSDKVTLTGTRTRLLDITEAASETNPTVHQGIVTVDVQVDPTERELLPQLVILGDAVERVYKGIAYLGFKNNQDSGVRAKFVVPAAGLPLNPKLKIRAQLFGRADGTLTDLDTSYYISARPTSGSPTPIGSTDTALTMNTSAAVTADEIHEFESEEISITAGDTVFVSIERAASGTPVYDNEIGLVRIGAIIVAGS